jgi:hypothetical protein
VHDSLADALPGIALPLLFRCSSRVKPNNAVDSLNPGSPIGSTTQALDALSALYDRLERSLLAAYCPSSYDTKAVDKLKPQSCEEFSMTARQFNSCWALLISKFASRVKADKPALSDVKAKLNSGP